MALRLEEESILRQLQSERELTRMEKANRLSIAWYLRSLATEARCKVWLNAYSSAYGHASGLEQVRRALLGGFGVRLSNEGAQQLILSLKSGTLDGTSPLELFEKLSPELVDDKLKEGAKADLLAELESQEKLEEGVIEEAS